MKCNICGSERAIGSGGSSVPLAKCSCGAKRSVKAYDTIYGHAYKCIKCGLESYPSKQHKTARVYWNIEVEKKLKELKGE